MYGGPKQKELIMFGARERMAGDVQADWQSAAGWHMDSQAAPHWSVGGLGFSFCLFSITSGVRFAVALFSSFQFGDGRRRSRSGVEPSAGRNSRACRAGRREHGRGRGPHWDTEAPCPGLYRSSVLPRSKSRKRSLDSSSRTTVWARRPWRVLLRTEFCFPLSVTETRERAPLVLAA